MEDSSGETASITDSSLIVYYKFHPSNYVNGAFRSLGYSSGVPGPNLYLNNTKVSFEYMEWAESLSFSTPSTLETINQSITLYDGLSCNN